MAESDLAAFLRTFDPDDRRRGRQFEEVCRWYLLNDPVYRAQLRQVWLWDDWPGRWGEDAGIDLVAETRDGRLWAVQAKAYHPDYSIKKADIDSFLSESARPEFAYRLLIATTDKVARLAERTMRAQEKPVGQILLHDLDHAEVVWPSTVADLRRSLPERKSPRPHQQEAIDAVVKGFSEADRGQLIMACGTGKTLLAMWTSEALRTQRVLVLVPSLTLLKETIRVWLLNSAREFEFLPVCSDDTVREQDQMVAHVADLGFPATGEPDEVAEFLNRPGPRVVFATYQSSPVVASAMGGSEVVFDLAIADEAHRCTGPASSQFATILDPEQIRADKRLFMTATPRYFTGRVRKAGIEADFEIASMDDDTRFGAVLHRLTFGEAIQRDLLSDYRVFLIGVDDETYREYAERGRFVTRDGKEVTDARLLAAQICLAKAMRKYDLRRIITFHGRVKAAQEFSESLPDVIAWMPAEQRPDGEVWATHVSGMMNSSQRETPLARLRHVGEEERGILSNARCLAEGVDVPSLDGVAFIDPKRSVVDIAQAVGRVIRKAEGKGLGTIMIPVFVEPSADPEHALKGSPFKPVWDVIRALRDHDAELAESLDEMRRALARGESPSVQSGTKIVIDMPVGVGDDFVRAFETRLVESTTPSWEFWYGLLEVFVGRGQTSRVPQNHEENGFRLGSWVGTQREFYRRGALSRERARRLEALPGWTWDAVAALWEEGFAHLRHFVERGQTSRVRLEDDENGFRLGIWVNTQRTSYRMGKLDSERTRRLEALPDWSWEPQADAWEEGFAHLRNFVERDHTSRVPNQHEENGFGLSNWVVGQRSLYRMGKLDSERTRRLEALPDWSWEPQAGAWEEGFAYLQNFMERKHTARVPQDHDENGFKLGGWVREQRFSYRKGKLDSERTRRLEALPDWSWNTFSSAWEDGFAHLQRFVEREQTSRIRADHEESGFRLGRWVDKQRSAYRRGKLALERAQRLEALPGWTWDALSTLWEESFAYLRRFVEREHTSRVRQNYEENGFRLGNWVATQRSSYRTGRLAPEWAQRLEALPDWTWNTLSAAWEEGFSHLRRFMEREQTSRVPKSHDENGFNLGGWVNGQRSSYRTGRLAPEWAQRLEALPDWTWNTLSAAWEEGFSHLRRFVEREQTSRVPHDHDENGFKLGTWVSRQRTARKKGNLDPSRERRLADLPGWTWTIRRRRARGAEAGRPGLY